VSGRFSVRRRPAAEREALRKIEAEISVEEAAIDKYGADYEKAKAALRAASADERDFNGKVSHLSYEWGGQYRHLVDKLTQLNGQKKSAKDALASCIQQNPGSRLLASRARSAKCTAAGITLAVAQGRAAGDAAVVRAFARNDFASLAAAVAGEAAKLRASTNPKARKAARHAAVAAASLRKLAADVAATRAALKKAQATIKSAQAALTACQSTGG
jgi:chromosome segregation ATPase